jgi:hypothetical protein
MIMDLGLAFNLTSKYTAFVAMQNFTINTSDSKTMCSEPELPDPTYSMERGSVFSSYDLDLSSPSFSHEADWMPKSAIYLLIGFWVYFLIIICFL